MTPIDPAAHAHAPAEAAPKAGPRSKPTVSFLILALVLGSLLPLLGIVAILFIELRHDLNTTALRQAESIAASEASIVSGQIHDMGVTLRVIASSPELATGNLQAFYDRTKAALAGSSWFLLLVDDTGQQLLNSRVPIGSALGTTSDLKSLQQALSSRKFLVSDAFFGRVGRQWVFNAVLPLPETGPNRAAALILTQNVTDIDAKIDETPLPAGWTTALVDGANHVMASSGALPPGSTLSGSYAEGFPKSRSASTIRNGLIIASAAIPDTADWRVLVWGPSAVAESPLIWSWWQLIFGGGLLIAVSLTFAFLTGRMIHRAIAATSAMAASMGRGETISIPELPFKEAQMIASVIGEASDSRREAERRLSVALRELAHRLKNLIMVVQGLVRQTGRHTGDVAEFRRLLSDRLDGLSNSINLLIAHQKGAVPVEELVRAQLSSFSADWDRVTFLGDRVFVRDEAVQGLGMILHELATNATKYGALSQPGGAIRMSWSEDPRTRVTQFVWRETGLAHSTGQTRGFGSELIEGTAAALGGSAVLTTEGRELVWTLRLRLSAPTPAD